jgi:hypothetical protein
MRHSNEDRKGFPTWLPNEHIRRAKSEQKVFSLVKDTDASVQISWIECS